MFLIIGCGGYLGSRLATQLLAKGASVRGLILPNEYAACERLIESGLDCWVGDLTKIKDFRPLCKGIDCVYYFAGGHFRTIQRTNEVYIYALQRLIDALQYERVQCVLYSSNGAVYGRLGGLFHKEDDIISPIHPFGMVVGEAEQLLLRNGALFNPVILRIGEVYGGGKHNPFNYSRNQLTLLGDGQNYISLIHEYDLLSLLIMAPRLDPGIYNVTDNMPVIQSEYYHYIETVCGHSFLKWVDQKEMPERVLFSIHGLRTLNIKMSNQKIRRATNYIFRYPSYKTGLQMLWQEYADEGLPGRKRKN